MSYVQVLYILHCIKICIILIFKYYRGKKPEPTYKAIWAENTSFDEVLISNKMVQDHMPDTVLEVLRKVWILSLSKVCNHKSKNKLSLRKEYAGRTLEYFIPVFLNILWNCSTIHYKFGNE